ncbi:MAG: efflux RND transporter periplasmic adaptor subunit [Abyssibacter sp.]|uniref:efflux RND transporter periplasmic adaptor subunit n=1 Tax=Abyssibacter sp. TaxID=2320200 RepID=UPI00321B306E
MKAWIGLVGLLGMGLAWAQPPATPVQVDPVRVASTAGQLRIVARVVAPEAGEIAARTAGTIIRYAVDVGDTVRAGSVLAELDRKSQTSTLALAKADLARAEAQAVLAREQMQRVQALRGSSAFSESLLDQRTAELGVAEADVQLARVNVASAQTDYDWGLVKAPFPGVVTARPSNVGAWVNRGQPVVSLVNPAAFEIEADVPANRLRGLTAGTPVTVELASASLTGRIRAIVPAENPSTRTRPVRIAADIPPTLEGLAANASARVVLPLAGTSDALTVHKDAINRRGDAATVYVVEDGKAAVRPVTLGDAVGNRLVVREGLAAGELVVIRGNERLRPGQAVRFDPPGGADS